MGSSTRPGSSSKASTDVNHTTSPEYFNRSEAKYTCNLFTSLFYDKLSPVILPLSANRRMSLKSQAKNQSEMPCWTAFAAPLQQLLQNYGLQIIKVDCRTEIPGSFWGDNEAGLQHNRLYLRDDTPLHSALHEAGHYICMAPERRAVLDTNAGGDYAEENAVCFLQAIMADAIPGYGRYQLFTDMDEWGYSFRLGSARAWFEQDAADACEWLIDNKVISSQQQLTGRLRQ